MKKIGFLVVCLLGIFVISCQKESTDPVKKTGSLSIHIGLSVNVHDVNSGLKSTHQTENFKVVIYKADGSVAMSFESVLVMPDTVELEVGDYYVEAHSDNDLPAAFENPYYYGVSDQFTINSNAQLTVEVSCVLSNSVVSVTYSDQVTGSFSDYTTTVSSALGSLIFGKDETRMGYFHPSPLDILVELFYLKPDGTESNKSLSGSIPDPQPNKHYEICVDASISEGMGSFQILLDESPAVIEIIDISEGTSSQPGAVGYGDLLITEIMYDPSVLSDTEGEWFEIYNTTGETIPLQNLILGRDDANRHTITETIDLPPSGYYVFKRSDQASDAINSYTYGSDITLSNTGAVLSVYNEGTEAEPGSLIFSVDYGGVDFPDGSGASICLSPDLLNATDAVSGTSWCISTSLYSTGDAGTPGLINDSCQ